MKSNFTRFHFSQLAAHDYILSSTQIDIWQYPLHTTWATATDTLDQSELKRAQQFQFTKHQRRFTVAHAILRLILARYLPNMKPDELKFDKNKYGKPNLVDNPSLQFNLSHAQEFALLAIGQDYPLGIDLEFFSARPYLGIGSQLFSDAENRAFEQLRPCLKPLSFFHIWAQKEAFIKACGLGLSYPTKQFDVPHLPVTDKLIEDTLHQQPWKIVSFMPSIACSAAVCHHPNIKNIRYIILEDIHDFIK